MKKDSVLSAVLTAIVYALMLILVLINMIQFVSLKLTVIAVIPLIIILPCFFGLRGVELTQCISDFLSFLSCIPLLILFFRDLRRREMQEGSCETH